MSKTNHALESFSVHDILKNFEGDASAYRRLFEAVGREISATQVLLVSTLPRGGAQILQPVSAPEQMIKLYNRDLFAQDKATWQALLKAEPLTLTDIWGDSLESSAFYTQLLQPNRLHHGAVVRVSAPLLRGYAGALHVYRGPDDHAFSAKELTRLAEIAAELAAALETMRESRRKSLHVAPPALWENASGCRQLIFDAHGQSILASATPAPIDDRLEQAIRHQAQVRLSSSSAESITTDRIELPDNFGEMWAFRVVHFKTFPALGNGPVIFFCLQPLASEWVNVRPADVGADLEMARLVPTLKFMHSEFHRTPTLDEIAAKAHLSPFHFHRRFTELLGQTPKHYLLSCQIQRAKRLLVERKVALADIAAECGFAHQSHFTSRFKQATGLTPTRWRRYATDLVKGIDGVVEAASVTAAGYAA